MNYNWVGWKSFVGPANGILIMLFESTKEVFGNCKELSGLDHLVCQEVSERFIIVYDTSILVYEQTLMVYIQWHIKMRWNIYELM